MTLKLQVNQPFKREAVAEAVFKRLGQDAVQTQNFVVDEREFVFEETQLLNAPKRGTLHFKQVARLEL